MAIDKNQWLGGTGGNFAERQFLRNRAKASESTAPREGLAGSFPVSGRASAAFALLVGYGDFGGGPERFE
jgi:hypothetical protein